MGHSLLVLLRAAAGSSKFVEDREFLSGGLRVSMRTTLSSDCASATADRLREPRARTIGRLQPLEKLTGQEELSFAGTSPYLAAAGRH